MLNEKYILQRIGPYLNTERELGTDEFSALFGELEHQEQQEIIQLVTGHGIQLVSKKSPHSISFVDPAPVTLPKTEFEYEKMLRLTNEELCVLAQRGDNRATAAILKKNEAFVRKEAAILQKQFTRTNLTLDDLIQEGNLGLLYAIEKFDPSLDNKLLTYAASWIRQRINRAAVDTGYTIRLPVHMFDKIKKISIYRRNNPEAGLQELTKLLQEDGFEATPEDIQLYVKLGEQYLNTASLNDLIGKDGGTEIQDFVPDPDIAPVEDAVTAAMLRDILERVLGSLTPREEKVLRIRFGLEDGRQHTLEEVGEVFGLTRERIRQIEAKALRKLRHPSRSKQLRDFLD